MPEKCHGWFQQPERSPDLSDADLRSPKLMLQNEVQILEVGYMYELSSYCLLDPIESCIQSDVTFLQTDMLRPSHLHEGRRCQRTDPHQFDLRNSSSVYNQSTWIRRRRDQKLNKSALQPPLIFFLLPSCIISHLHEAPIAQTIVLSSNGAKKSYPFRMSKLFSPSTPGSTSRMSV